MLKKSIIIAGRHQTSISIEPEFYEELLWISHKENRSLNSLITEIDNHRLPTENLSSAIRVYILKYLKKQLTL